MKFEVTRIISEKATEVTFLVERKEEKREVTNIYLDREEVIWIDTRETLVRISTIADGKTEIKVYGGDEKTVAFSR